MKKLMVLFVCLFSLFQLGLSNGNDYYQQLALSGNAQYDAGNYDSARTLYAQVVNANFASANLYYNLGNTYFKLNQLAPAIYYLEKAHKLAPFDKDIEFNLNMAKDQITDRIKDVPTPILNQGWSKIRNLMRIDGWGILATIAFALFILLIGYYLLSTDVSAKKIAFFLSIGFFLLTAVSLTFGFSAKHYVTTENQAVVFAGSLSVKSEPRASSSDLFIVHEGTTVNVLEEVNQWVRISLPDGNEGWAPLSELKRF